MGRYLMGIDVGTSACKVAVFDEDGTAVAQSTRTYPVFYPEPGWAEQNPEDWWRGVRDAIQALFHEGRVSPDEIAGIGVDGQSWSAIPVDQTGRVLHNTPIWMDTRAAALCEETIARIGSERILDLAGNAFNPTYSTPKIQWFKRFRPDIYRDATSFLQCNSYIVMQLTGERTQDVCQGYGLHCFDIRSLRYDDAMCDALGIDREKLPPVFACHDVVGGVTKAVAKETGLKAGTPVVAGGLDAACGTLGAGVLEVGQTQEQGGQAGGMSICAGSAIAHPALILSTHVVPDRWLLQGGTVGGGGTLKWFHEQFGAAEDQLAKETGRSAFSIMDDEAALVPAGSEGLVFLPYLAGERSPIWDRNASGVWLGLNYGKTRAHMIRSTMEGVAYSLLHNLKTAETAGVTVGTMNAMGGAANSRVWTQIKADVTGRVIRVPASDTATTLGAAMLAGVGTGVWRSFDEAVHRTVQIRREHVPNPANAGVYGKRYAIYLELYERLKDTMQRCAEMN